MTQSRIPLTDARLDRILDTWLGEGPESVADRVTEAALLTVSTTRQKHPGGPMSRFAPDRPAFRLITGLAAVVAIAAVGFGLWRSTDVGVDPTPTPSVEPTASASPRSTPRPTPVTFKTLSYPVLGWEVDLPENWYQAERDTNRGPLPDPVRAFGANGEPGGGFTVSLGDSDGQVQYCSGLGACQLVIATSLEELVAVVYGEPGLNLFVSDLVPTEVGGESAREFTKVNLDAVGERELYLLAFHSGRPLIIHFHPTPGVEEYRWDQLRYGFRFLDSATYSYPEGGYSITLSDDWALWNPGAFHAQTAPELTLWIFAGTPDGHLACSYGPYSIFGQTPESGPACSELVFRTRADLVAVVQATKLVGTIDLAGREVALYQRFTFEGYDYAFYDVHDGRPFVMHVAFTYSADANRDDPQQITRRLQEAIAGFVFLP